MKNLFIILFLIILFACESSNVKSNIDDKPINIDENEINLQICNLNGLYTYVEELDIREINLSKQFNDSISELFGIKECFTDSKSDSLKYISKVVLLKLYLYHLQTARQGYDLLGMRKSSSKLIIDYYLIENKIDTNCEFLNSGIVYQYEKENSFNDSRIKKIIDRIEIEIDYINQLNFKIINENEGNVPKKLIEEK